MGFGLVAPVLEVRTRWGEINGRCSGVVVGCLTTNSGSLTVTTCVQEASWDGRHVKRSASDKAIASHKSKLGHSGVLRERWASNGSVPQEVPPPVKALTPGSLQRPPPPTVVCVCAMLE